MNIFELILSTLISTGVITTVVATIISHKYDKKLHTHDIKIRKYTNLIEEFAKLVGNEPDWNKLRPIFNEALFFASDEVIGEILGFHKKIVAGKKDASGGSFKIDSKDLQSLVIAIRKDLYLKSKSIEKNSITFFQRQ
ncbi:MAG: hypothetical protein UX81_C0025G0013 [Parcubacteria group bacterium GW2011_GWA2_47_12]|nr:MAG: hypothetical protein UX81_C0025G0013 [Parcubacteria group bacterium GW2011_GWA2_47_12]